MTTNSATSLLSYSIAIIFSASIASAAGDDEWRIYSEEANGDVYFFDATRVETAGDRHKVWTRIRYKTSLMGASSYQSLLEVDCSERATKTLQRTFFSDKQWEKPAMSTDMNEKPQRPIDDGSAAERLSKVLCNQQ